jgi:hypothetical protein
MSTDCLCRRQPARLGGAPWLAIALLLIPALGSATERAAPAVHAGHAVSPTAKPRIGRIFFSPAERRSAHLSVVSATPATPATATRRVAADERLYVNGSLSSGTQARTVWVNGAAIENSTVNKTAWTDRQGNVWLNNGAQGTHLVRPGQSIDRGGAIEDLLPPGSLTRH